MPHAMTCETSPSLPTSTTARQRWSMRCTQTGAFSAHAAVAERAGIEHEHAAEEGRADAGVRVAMHREHRPPLHGVAREDGAQRAAARVNRLRPHARLRQVVGIDGIHRARADAGGTAVDEPQERAAGVRAVGGGRRVGGDSDCSRGARERRRGGGATARLGAAASCESRLARAAAAASALKPARFQAALRPSPSFAPALLGVATLPFAGVLPDGLNSASTASGVAASSISPVAVRLSTDGSFLRVVVRAGPTPPRASALAVRVHRGRPRPDRAAVGALGRAGAARPRAGHQRRRPRAPARARPAGDARKINISKLRVRVRSQKRQPRHLLRLQIGRQRVLARRRAILDRELGKIVKRSVGSAESWRCGQQISCLQPKSFTGLRPYVSTLLYHVFSKQLTRGKLCGTVIH